ncbi:unnamed protein product [Paramecium octaurelia]|uniref:Uncharacterized protein n=1 Tax=Paramecium octaurelia TaxID=43137 RepID=A0A8S1YDL8_PAROT|nr:unnamed protein product [Paramecium octaurelia]
MIQATMMDMTKWGQWKYCGNLYQNKDFGNHQKKPEWTVRLQQQETKTEILSTLEEYLKVKYDTEFGQIPIQGLDGDQQGGKGEQLHIIINDSLGMVNKNSY